MDQRFALSVLGFFCRSQFLLDLIANGGCKRCHRFKVLFFLLIEFFHSTHSIIDIILVRIGVCQQCTDLQCRQCRYRINIGVLDTVVLQDCLCFFQCRRNTVLSLFEFIQLVHHKNKSIARLFTARFHTLSHFAQQDVIVIHAKLRCIHDIQYQCLGRFRKHSSGCDSVGRVAGIVGTRRIDQYQRYIISRYKRDISLRAHSERLTFLLVQFVHYAQRKVLITSEQLTGFIVSLCREAGLVIIMNFRDFSCTRLILSRH